MIVNLPCKFECLRGKCATPGIIQKSCEIRKKVHEKINARFRSHNKKTTQIGLLPLEISDIEYVFIKAAANGFICPHCERPLDLWASSKKDALWGIARAVSLDHYIPLRSGKSTNHVTNLYLACHECNTVKGVTDPLHWETTVENIKKDHGLHGFWKYLDANYGIASSREINSGWWGNKKQHKEESP